MWEWEMGGCIHALPDENTRHEMTKARPPLSYCIRLIVVSFYLITDSFLFDDLVLILTLTGWEIRKPYSTELEGPPGCLKP